MKTKERIRVVRPINGYWHVRVLKEGIDIEAYKVKYPDAYFLKCKPPTEKTLMKWSWNGYSRTPCGCKVEEDGHCPHGRPSWHLISGLV